MVMDTPTTVLIVYGANMWTIFLAIGELAVVALCAQLIPKRAGESGVLSKNARSVKKSIKIKFQPPTILID